MAFFFGDGFDLYALPADAVNGHWDSGALNFILSAGRFSGSRAIQSSNIGTFFVKSSGQNDAVHHIVCAFQQTAALTGTTLGLYFQLTDGTTNQCCIVFRTDGAILLTSATPAGTVLATYTGAVTAINTWYAFEFEVVINNTTGSFTVRKNGNTTADFTATSLNTRPGTNSYANKLTVGQNGSVSFHFIDDLLWRSDPTSVPWAGDIRCYTRLPNTDAAAAWTRPSTFQMQPYAGTTTNAAVGANTPRYTPFVSQGGNIGNVVINLAVGWTGNMKCAIFAATTGSQPGTVIQSATAAINNPVIGTNTFTFSPAVSVAKGTQFFVGFVSDTAASGALPTGNGAPYSTMGFTGGATYATFPIANPTVTAAATASGFFPVVTPTANADAVADSFEDSAASYVSSANPGDTDRYTLGAISGTPTSILGVVTRAYMQKSDAGSRTVAVQLTSSSTTVESGAVAPSSSGWGWVERTDLTDPATGAAWTATGVNNAQIGVTVKT
jgi:hypothetical protein